MIAVLDYGMGNLGSVLNMFKKVGAKAVITSDPEIGRSAEKILLPGIGAFDAGMQSLEASGFRPLLDECVLHMKKPVLGICLGTQLMTNSSEEGELPGLGWVNAEVKRFRPSNPKIKVPHMGWNQIQIMKEDPLIAGLTNESRFYFVHSYQVVCRNLTDVLLQTTYGTEFHSAFCIGNVWGVQFHPDKSHKFGMRLLKNFSEFPA